MNYLSTLPREIQKEICLYLDIIDIDNIDKYLSSHPGIFEDDYFWLQYFKLRNLPFFKQPTKKDYYSMISLQLDNFPGYDRIKSMYGDKTSFYIDYINVSRLITIGKFNPIKYLYQLNTIAKLNIYDELQLRIKIVTNINNFYEFDVGTESIHTRYIRDTSIFKEIIDDPHDHVTLSSSEYDLFLMHLYMLNIPF